MDRPTTISEDPGPYEPAGRVTVMIWRRKLSIQAKICETCQKKRASIHARIEMPDQKTIDRYTCEPCFNGWFAH
jgi:hypothetical protein